MKMLLEMNLLLVFILRIVVASTSDEEEDYDEYDLVSQLKPQGNETCPTVFQNYYKSLLEQNEELHEDAGFRFRLQVDVKPSDVFNWKSSLSPYEESGYKKCYEQTGKGKDKIARGPCAAEFQGKFCPLKFIVNKFYPACCETDTDKPKCYCECIYFCETKENTMDHLNEMIESEDFTKCKDNHHNMRVGKSWKKKMCKKTLKSKEYKEWKKKCHDHKEDDYARCVGTGYCFGTVCKHCYRWQCASQLSHVVKEADEKQIKEECSKIEDAAEKEKCISKIQKRPPGE